MNWKKLLLIAVVAGGFAFVAAPRSEGGVSVGIGLGFPGYGYGYYPYGDYRSWSTRPYPWGYGGVRDWRAPYGYEPSADRYEEPPRPPAPVWEGAGYEAGPDGDEN